MGKVSFCVFVLALLCTSRHQCVAEEPNFGSILCYLFCGDDSSSSEDIFGLCDDCSDSDSDSELDSTEQKPPPILNLTIPPSKNGMHILVTNKNGQMSFSVDTLSGGAPGGAATDAPTIEATTAAGTTGGTTAATTEKA